MLYYWANKMLLLLMMMMMMILILNSVRFISVAVSQPVTEQ